MWRLATDGNRDLERHRFPALEQEGTVGFLAVVLACPLMMFVMMKMMMGHQSASSHHDDRPVDQGQER